LVEASDAVEKLLTEKVLKPFWKSESHEKIIKVVAQSAAEEARGMKTRSNNMYTFLPALESYLDPNQTEDILRQSLMVFASYLEKSSVVHHCSSICACILKFTRQSFAPHTRPT